MPPKVKVTKEKIIQSAVGIIRKNGWNAVNARAIAKELECSTQPIFSNFATMEELQEAVLLRVHEEYLEYLKREAESGKYPQYKAFGMAYIRFAKEETELFKLLFMRDRQGEDFTPTVDFEKSVELIMQANGVDKETAMLIHLEVWTCVHGIATMLATAFVAFDEELVSKMVSDIYHGIRARHLVKGE